MPNKHKPCRNAARQRSIASQSRGACSPEAHQAFSAARVTSSDVSQINEMTYECVNNGIPIIENRLRILNARRQGSALYR
ncbi:hypothetical protein METHP15_1110012 [Pseudomonas sp. P15-2025]